MGSTSKRIVSGFLAAVLAFGLVPAVPVATVTRDAAAAEGVSPSASDDRIYAGDGEVTAKTQVEGVVEEVLEGFEIVGETYPAQVLSSGQTATLKVHTTEGAAPYQVQWTRTLVEGAVEGEPESVGLAVSIASPGKDESGKYLEFSTSVSYDDLGDVAKTGKTYNYYVTITDSKGQVASTWSDTPADRRPYVVSTSNMWADKTVNDVPPWSVAAAFADDGAGGLKQLGWIAKGSYLSTALRDAGDTAYDALYQSAVESGRAIATIAATSVGGGAGAPAAWRVAITNVPDGSEASGAAFVGSIVATLDLLDVLGISKDDWADETKYSAEAKRALLDEYTLLRTGGGTGAMSELAFNDDGTVTFVITATGSSAAPGDLGTFALARKLKPGEGDAFTVTPRVWAAGGGQIDPSEAATFLTGATPEFALVADDGYRVSAVRVYRDGEAEPEISLPGEGESLPMTYSLFKFPNARVDGKWVALDTASDQWAALADADKWNADATIVAEFEPIPNAADQFFNVTVSAGDGGYVLSNDTKLTGSNNIVKLPANKPAEFELVPLTGFEVDEVLMRERAGVGWTEWAPASAVGHMLRISKLVCEVQISVTFTDDFVDDIVTHRITGEVITGEDSGKVELSDGLAYKDVAHGGSVVFNVMPASGWYLDSARMYTLGADGVLTEGAWLYRHGVDGTWRYDSATDQLTVPNIVSDVVVRFAFEKSSDEPSGGGAGAVETPDMVNVAFAGVCLDGEATPTTDGWKVTPAMGAGATYRVGSKQTFAFLPDPAGDKEYVIRYVRVDYGADTAAGVEASSESIAPLGGINYISLTVRPRMTVTVFMREKEPYDKGPVSEFETIESGVVMQPGAELSEDGKTLTVEVEGGHATIELGDDGKAKWDPTANGGAGGWSGAGLINPATDMPYVDAGGNIVGAGGMIIEDGPNAGLWDAGGSIIPSSVPVVPGESQEVVVAPKDNSGTQEDWYWLIDELRIDGAALIPYAADDPSHPEQGNGVFSYYPPSDGSSVGKGYIFKRYTESDGVAPELVGTVIVPYQIGDTFTFNERTGVIAFDSVTSAHNIDAAFERALDVGVDVNVDVRSNHGQAAASKTVWKAYKKGEKIRIAATPEKGYKLVSMLVGGDEKIDSDSMSAEGSVGVEDVRGVMSALQSTLMSKTYRIASGSAVQAKRSLGNTSLGDALLGVLDVEEAHADELSDAKDVIESLGYDPSLMRVYTLQDSDVPDGRTGTRTLQVFTKYEKIDSSKPEGPGGNVPSGPGGISGGGSDEDVEYFTVTATVVSGHGWIEREGQVESSVRVKRGGSYKFTLGPDAGWQVTSVTVDGKPLTPGSAGALTGTHEWTGNTFTVRDVQSPLKVEVTFGMLASTGDNSDTARTIRRITAMLRTGDEALPLAIAAFGVALGAVGVAVIAGKRRRHD